MARSLNWFVVFEEWLWRSVLRESDRHDRHGPLNIT